MPDNVTVDNGTGTDFSVAADKITYSGDADQAVQLVKLVTVSGAEGSKTATDVMTGVQYVEDTAIAADAGQGTLVVARRDDALTSLTPAENDAVGLRVNSAGALWVTLSGQSDLTGDGFGPSTLESVVGTVGGVYNGSDFDRARAINGLGSTDANTGIPAVAVVPHKVGYALASATAQYTTTQTSTILGPTNAATAKPVVTSIQIQAGGTVAGTVQVYFGTGAYSRGTTPAIFDGEFAPSATLKPGYAQSPAVPYSGVGGDEVRVTTSAAINPLTVTIWYYLVTV